MFYQEQIDYQLRFGDVLRGFISTTPIVKDPILDLPHNDYRIEIRCPEFSVVLSPCCSISETDILLTPLLKINKKFLENPSFVNDLTIINKKIEPTQALSPDKWGHLTETERQQRMAKGKDYALNSIFIYGENDLFKKYDLEYEIEGDKKSLTTQYYMIDFGNVYKITSKDLKPLREDALKTKCLQLTIETRDLLRAKITHYFGRVPVEDSSILKG